jgi:anti-sigma factor RsiW
MNADDMSCQELVELVTDYLDGALPGRERRRFERHLEECEWCVNYVDQIRTTIGLAARTHADAAELPGIERLLDAFRDWKRGALA